MNMAFVNKITDIKTGALELAGALMREPEEIFNREHAIMDLFLLIKGIHALEDECLKTAMEKDRKIVSALAEYKERLYAAEGWDKNNVRGERKNESTIPAHNR